MIPFSGCRYGWAIQWIDKLFMRARNKKLILCSSSFSYVAKKIIKWIISISLFEREFILFCFCMNGALSRDIVYGYLIHCFPKKWVQSAGGYLFWKYFVRVMCRSLSPDKTHLLGRTLSQNGLLKVFCLNASLPRAACWTVRRDTEKPVYEKIWIHLMIRLWNHSSQSHIASSDQ